MLADALGWALAWLGCLAVLAIVAYPLTARLLAGLPSRGVALSPIVGLLLVSYLSWILASVHLVPFGRLSLLGAVGIVALLSAISGFADRARPVRWLRLNLRVVAIFALMFVVLFALFFWLRGFYPDVRSTEKPMEISFLTSTMRARWMPPHDAWLSGYGINYYYFGYVEAASLGLLSGVRPEVAFNLMSISLPALTFCGASGIVYDLLIRFRREHRERARAIRPLLASVVGGLLVAIAGNAFGFARLLTNPAGVIDANFWTGIGWNSTRVVKDHIIPGSVAEMITEFPLFSFLLGDIHPHVLALPTVLLAIAVAISHWLRPVHAARTVSGRSPARANAYATVPQIAGTQTRMRADTSATTIARAWTRFCPDAGRYVLTALVIGALYPTNAWDLPTFTLPILAAVAFCRPERWTRIGGRVALLCGGAVLLYLPYYLHFKSLVGNPGDVPAFVQSLEGEPVIGTIIRTFGIVTWPHTSLSQFLAVFAVPLLAASTLVFRGTIGRPVTTFDERRAMLIAAVSIGAIALLTRTAMLLPTGVIAVAGILALRRPVARTAGEGGVWSVWTQMDRAMVAIAVYGTLLPVIPEFVFLRDAFDNRMNTMFKVDYQSWVLLMIAGAYGVVTLVWSATFRVPACGWIRGSMWDRDRPSNSELRSSNAPFPRLRLVTIITGLALLAVMASVYPFFVPFQRTGHFGAQGTDFGGAGNGWQGLDGFQYVRETNPDEFQAMRWLRDHAGPDDRLVEAVGNSYGESHGWFQSRFAASTGIPDVLGWYFHEVQWRGGSPEIINRELPARAADIGMLYNTTDVADARRILAKYGITWVVVGLTEEEGEGHCAVPLGCPPYAAQGLAKFNDMLDLAFRSGPVSIYRVT